MNGGLIVAHIAGVAALAAAGGAINAAALRRTAAWAAGDDASIGPELGRLEVLGLTGATVAAVALAWTIVVVRGTGSAWSEVIEAMMAAITASASILFVADDARHQTVQPEVAGICIAAGVLWAWAAGGDAAAGDVAVAAALAGVGVASVRLVAETITGEAPVGDGEWMVFAVAGVWVGGDLGRWVILGWAYCGASVVQFAWRARLPGERLLTARVAMAPSIAAGVMVALAC